GGGPGVSSARGTDRRAGGAPVGGGPCASSAAGGAGGSRRIDNVTDAALATYRRWYGPDVAKDHVFAFVYGLLHSPDYRTRFAADLKRSLPRIPRIDAADFVAFRNAGQALLDLHIGYEDAAPYPLTITGAQPTGPGSADLYDWFRVERLRWAGKGRAGDRSAIVYNPRITVSGIPDAAHRYMLGSRSALEWVLDRYQVKTDTPSGIVNDPNDWSREVGNPRYILDLIAKVTTVSVETMRIVDALPPLRIHEDQS
ncbi:MAG TPA: damage-inducible protein, partial [Actinotalea sp.]|nr:damage-inducible protein [Actinotalea sp.]